MKKSCLILVLVFFSGFMFLLPHGVFAGSGEDIFNSKCGSCHGSGGEAPSFSPVKYASSQWERFFKRDKHARKKDISGIVSASDIESISKYLMSHAADSDLPIAAGLK